MKFPYDKVREIQARYQAGKLDREAAKEQLAYLLDLKSDNDFCVEAVKAESYNDSYPFQSYGPLLRLSDVCNILRTWAKAYVKSQPNDDEYKTKDRSKMQEAWGWIDLQIRKSCLLDRLFFQDENLRTEPCPEHKGRWSGCDWNSPGCACRNGSNVTGWLPAPEFTGYSDMPDQPLCDFCGKPPLKQGLWSSRVDNKHGHPDCMDANPTVNPNGN
jgi:hypothetical protein